MLAVADRPTAASDRQGLLARAGREAPRSLSAAHVLWWRWLPVTTPRLRLGPAVRPGTRLEIALCALFRCRREWSARELVERLALAPAHSNETLALMGPLGAVPLRVLGRGPAWDAVRDWIERGLLSEVEATSPPPEADVASAIRGAAGHAGAHSWATCSPDHATHSAVPR
jgi:hypothetical protein